jgi:hypothetical protein
MACLLVDGFEVDALGLLEVEVERRWERLLWLDVLDV